MILKNRYLLSTIAMFAMCCLTTISCTKAKESNARLLRVPYTSAVDNLERDYFLYLPNGYEERSTSKWPVIVFLSGDGQRGNGKEDLDYVLYAGPLYEAWIQKRDLPFIIISPQLHMFGRDGEEGPEYIRNRTRDGIPKRQEEGVPARHADMPALEWYGPMRGAVAAEFIPDPEIISSLNTTGWRRTDPDVITILDSVLDNYHADKERVYLTGLSIGGTGTFYYAGKYPEKFSAILPVVGNSFLEEAEAVARAGIPTWIFSGGRDPAMPAEYFFSVANRMEALGTDLRFTTEQDTFHDVRNRVYTGEDVYNWLLQYKK